MRGETIGAEVAAVKPRPESGEHRAPYRRSCLAPANDLLSIRRAWVEFEPVEHSAPYLLLAMGLSPKFS